MNRKVLGKRLPRIDSIPKATGAAVYTMDQKLPGMLYGRILRSPHAHAKIKSIDTSKAKALPGVHAVITAEDVPLNKFAFFGFLADKHMLCKNKVRYVGDEVAAVAAKDRDTADAAAELIEVEYEVLPAIFDPEESMKEGAMLLHEDKGTNVTFSVERNFGDVDKAFEECDFVVEGRYKTTQIPHCCLEMHNCVVNWEPTGRITLWTPTQAPHTQREELSRILGIPQKDIRIINSHMGGGFGSRLVVNMNAPIGAMLSKISGRPVKIVNTRAEELSCAKTRYGYTMYVKTGAMKDGTLVARSARVVADNGAYHDKGPATLNFSSMMYAAIYNIPNIRYEACLAYTNKQMGTAFRGFGNAQLSFACEVQIDELAEKMGMDPYELRLKNCNVSGETIQSGAFIATSGHKECLELAAKDIGWAEKKDQKGLKGVGIASATHTGQGGRYYGFAATNSFIKIADDGMVSLVSPGAEMGQGIHTVAAMIVCEELGVSLDRVQVLSNDTDLTPYDLGSWGSRGTFVVGNAALAAARNMKEKMVNAAAKMMEVKPEFIKLEDNKAIASVPSSPEKSVTLEELASYAINSLKAPLAAEGQWADDIPADWNIKEEFSKNVRSWAFSAQGIEVEVNEDTGEVKVLKIAAAHETGTTINQMMAEGQIEGPLLQGIGFALMEGLKLDENGRVMNDGFLDHKICTFGEQPEMKVRLVETGDPNGPFGAKGIGESGLVPTMAAIANAVYNACGVRCHELPITREYILNALKEKKKAN